MRTEPAESSIPEALHATIPPPPVYAEPPPPERPPPFRFAPSIMIAAAQRLNFQVLISINLYVRPQLRPVSTLPSDMLVPPEIARTGTVNPPLPAIGDNSSESSARLPRFALLKPGYGWESPCRRRSNHDRKWPQSNRGVRRFRGRPRFPWRS